MAELGAMERKQIRDRMNSGYIHFLISDEWEHCPDQRKNTGMKTHSRNNANQQHLPIKLIHVAC